LKLMSAGGRAFAARVHRLVGEWAVAEYAILPSPIVAGGPRGAPGSGRCGLRVQIASQSTFTARRTVSIPMTSNRDVGRLEKAPSDRNPVT